MSDITNEVTGEVGRHVVQAEDIAGGITIGRPESTDAVTVDRVRSELVTRMAARAGSADPVDLAVSAELAAIFALLAQGS